jgi:CheY-like chemotaxis protein
MPHINGYDLAKHIRSDERLRCMPLVALTGYGRREDRERALQAGFDLHLIKPVSFEMLQAALAELVERGQLASGQAQGAGYLRKEDSTPD